MNKVDVVLVGGGSGGHLTPLIPIAEALHMQNPNLKIVHIGQKNDPLNSITRSSTDFLKYFEVSAGKFRRYYGEKWYIRFFDLKTMLLNIRDVFRVLLGICQSWRLFGKIKPRVILAKGGFVGVPVGIAARLRGIPYITHDSDVVVSLANKIISKGAVYHTTAQQPEKYEGYAPEKTIYVGVPVRSQFKKVSKKANLEAKKKLGYSSDSKIILVLGGGLGARKINDAIVLGAQKLLEENRNLWIVHITGGKLFNETNNAYKNTVEDSLLSRIRTISFSDNLHILSAASDIIVTRAGATNIAEFSAQGKACIIVPNPLLAGGHQSKNAKMYEDLHAAIIIRESEMQSRLTNEIQNLVSSDKKRADLETKMNKLFVPDAATRIADLLLEVAND
jgi:UDP-N-acetylglucosamine--N-acetylmuramyl-(pentapeptide) pyrophosphoryl-undecaprenol N-acetylglucosamine transferase